MVNSDHHIYLNESYEIEEEPVYEICDGDCATGAVCQESVAQTRVKTRLANSSTTGQSVLSTGSRDDRVAETPVSSHKVRDKQTSGFSFKCLTAFVIAITLAVGGGFCIGYVSISVLSFTKY